MASPVHLETLVESMLESTDFVLIELKIQGSWNRPHIVITLDHKTRGITSGDCQALSRKIEEELDISDDFPRTYALDVTSPGLNVALVHEWQYKKNIGRELVLELVEEENSDSKKKSKKKKIQGKLEDFKDGTIFLEGERQFKLDEILEARVALPW